MIIIIILGVLLILSIVLLIIYENSSLFRIWSSDIVQCTGVMGTALSGLLIIILGSIALAINSNAECAEARNWYEQQVIQLNNTYEVLSNNVYNATAVQQYNSEVAEFKNKIIDIQCRLDNPWINWLNCKEYKNMSADAVQYFTL